MLDRCARYASWHAAAFSRGLPPFSVLFFRRVRYTRVQYYKPKQRLFSCFGFYLFCSLHGNDKVMRACCSDIAGQRTICTSTGLDNASLPASTFNVSFWTFTSSSSFTMRTGMLSAWWKYRAPKSAGSRCKRVTSAQRIAVSKSVSINLSISLIVLFLSLVIFIRQVRFLSPSEFPRLSSAKDDEIGYY